MKLQNLYKMNLYCNKCCRTYNLTEIVWRHHHPKCPECLSTLKISKKIGDISNGNH